MFKYARIRHDNPPRQSNTLRVYPETVAMGNEPKAGKGVVIPYPTEWIEWTRSINTKESADWLFTPHSMLFNIEYTDVPLAESISNSGNVVRVVDETSEFVRISRRTNDSVPPDGVNYFNQPFLVHKVCCMDRETLKLRKPDNGKDVYFPIIAKGASALWITKDRIEFFPALPFKTRIAQEGLLVYRKPSFSSRIIRSLGLLDEIEITEYRPRGNTVWGMINGLGWVCLQQGSRFNTLWKMETLPPP